MRHGSVASGNYRLTAPKTQTMQMQSYDSSCCNASGWSVIVENLAALWVEQQVASGGRRGLQAVAEKLSSSEEQLDVLELDGMELLDHDQDFAVALLCDPDAFATDLMDHILRLLVCTEVWRRTNAISADLDGRPARGSRLWIRLTSVPLPLLPVDTLQRHSADLTCTNGACTKKLVYVYGVVYAISTITRTVFRQRYICKVCKNAYDFYQGAELLLPPGCCHTLLREDIESHDYLPHQEIYLGPVPSVAMVDASAKPFSRVIVSVSLFDDLTGRLQLGDSVAVIGHASMAATACNPLALTPSGYRFAEVRITANNIFTPLSLNSLKLITSPKLQTSQAFRRKDGQISLEKLCKTICHGPWTEVWPKLLPTALLLSLVASDSSKSGHQGPSPLIHSLFDASAGGGLCGRKQIHVLLATSSFSSANSLQSLQAAALYAARSFYDAGGNDAFLSKVKQEDASKEKQMLYAGCLALSKGGVLILDLSLLSKAKTRNLCEAMEKGPVSLQQHRPHQVSLIGSTTTIWASQEVSRASGAANARSNQSKTKLNHSALLRGFDIILEESLDLYSDDLQQHLLTASSISSASITGGAHELIRSYYLALRRNKEFNDGAQEQDDASLLTLQSLLRVAEACARLCLRTEIQEIPDATLAILLYEKSHVTKFGRSIFQDHQVVTRDQGRSAHDVIGILKDDAFDHELRGFHSDLVRCLYHLSPEE